MVCIDLICVICFNNLCNQNKLFLFVFLHEFIYSARGINEFLLTAKKRMAGRTDFYPYILFCRTRLECFPACAHYRCLLIIRMNLVFHDNLLVSCFTYSYLKEILYYLLS